MANILLVSDQERLVALFTSPGFLPEAKIHVARTIEQAFAAQPRDGFRFILIQERLGELSGQMVAYRIAAGSKGKKPRIVLLATDEKSGNGSGKQVQSIQCAGMSGDDIAAAARGLLSGPERKPGSRRNKPKKPAGAEPGAGRIITPPPVTEMVDDVVELGTTAAHPGATPRARSETATPNFQEKLDSVLTKTAAVAFSATPEASATHVESRPAPLLVNVDREGIAGRILKLMAGRKPAAMVIATVAATTMLALFAVIKLHKAPINAGPGNSTTVRGSATSPDRAVPAKKELRTLPSFVPPRSLDKDYGKNHPGWERHLTPTAEFRIYRERGTLREILVIDRSGKGMQEGLFASVLNEISSNRNYLVEKREIRGSFQVDTGQLANGARVIVYRHVPGNRVKTLVIDLR